MRKKWLLLILVVAILAVSIPVTLALIHRGQQPSNGGTAEVPSDNSTTEPTAPPTTPSTLTMLSITDGNVFIMKAGTASWIEAQVRMSLEAGDSVKSGNSSSAKITFFDGSTIELEADTEIKVASLNISDSGSTTISLKQAIGSTISRVTKLVDSASSYEVETPACVAAVRGSVMLVNVIDDGTTWVTNQEGNIWVIANGVELQIPEGRKCIIISGQPPQLVPSSGGGGGGGGGGGFSPNPDISITKMPDLIQAHEGDAVNYTYTVTNPGNVPLSQVSVTDDKIKDVTYQSGDTNGDGRLGTDEIWIFSTTYNVTAGDVSPLVNTAAAAGTYASSQTIIAWTTASVYILRPAIAINKTAEPAQIHEGDTITYTYTITNPGNTPLSGISVTDDKAGNITYDSGYQSGDTNEDEILDVDETWLFTATYNVTINDVSPLINIATVSGTDTLFRSVKSEDTASVDILRPAIAVNKTAEPTQAYVGHNITYTYTITNASNTPLSAISVTDDKAGNIIYEGGYQSGDTNGDEILDVDEIWVFTTAYTITTDDGSRLVNTAIVSGTDALSRSVESEEDIASVDILPVVVMVRFPEEGTAYIGYEDQQGGDFDYNDFGMNMCIEEVYIGDCLTEINMVFESAVKLAGGSHDIHILRTLSASTSYSYTITRSIPARGREKPAVTNTSGQGNFDIILFDTPYFTSGATVTIHIEITDGCEPYDPTPEPPRRDLSSIWAYYDPYMNYRTTPSTPRHIGDWQPAVEPLPTGYNVPYILVIPLTDWQAPAEGQCITNLYPYFHDYYATGSPPDWYEIEAPD